MLNYCKILVTLVLLLHVETLVGQPLDPAADYMYSIADEIIVIKVIDESNKGYVSLRTCESHVYAKIIEVIKATRLPSGDTTLLFSRIVDCDMTEIFPEKRKLKKGKRYLDISVEQASQQTEWGRYLSVGRHATGAPGRV